LNKRKSNEETSNSDSAKRIKRQYNSDPAYLTFFDKSMNHYISTAILDKMKSSQKLDADLLRFENDFTSKTRLPYEIIKNAVFFASLEPSVMENNSSKLIIELWKDY
ncbi:hypothetical protein CU098_007871, partial [Rhizopus stolonifer]